MAKIVSDAGEITLEIKSFQRDGNSIVVVGTMGIWEAKVYLSVGEAMRFITMALSSPAILLSIITYPLILLRRRLCRGEGKSAG